MDVQGDELPEGENDPAKTLERQDTFRKVYLGQVSDPLFPPHPGPPESSEDELTRLALEDPRATEPEPQEGPTLWRLLALIAFAVIALGIIFWWHH
jgi:hypothetical protein